MAEYKPQDYVAVHENPVWREKANFIIRIYLGESDGRDEWEQLWAQRLSNQRFRLCCIPFFAYGLELGDEVETDDQFVVLRVLKPSGHVAFRVWFGGSSVPTIKEEVVEHIQPTRALLEWSSENLLAISARDDEQAQLVADYLSDRQRVGDLVYERASPVSD